MVADTNFRNWLGELFVHDVGEKQRITRAAMSKGLGINPVDYARPYPGSNSSTVNNVTSANLPSTPAATAVAPTPAASTLSATPGPTTPATAGTSASTPTTVILAALAALGIGVGGTAIATRPATPTPAN